jgi:mono/diheme cytochrome c family protein
MKRSYSRFAALLLTAAFAGVPAYAQDSAELEARLAEAAQTIGGQWEMLDTYCVECHNFEEWAGGVAFDTMAPENVPADADVWESVSARLRARMMPPPGAPQPPAEQIAAFAETLETYLDVAAAGEPHPGYVPLHRMNRTEYARAVQELLALEIDAAALLPRDPESDGFDNIASMLGTSPSFIEQFVAAAQDVSIEAVGDTTPKTAVRTYQAEASNQDAYVEGLPLGTRGGMVVEHFFPADGQYEFDIGGLGGGGGYIGNLDHPHTVVLTIDDVRVFEADLGGDADMKAADQMFEPALAEIADRFQDIRADVTAGPHKVGVAFIARSFAKADDTLGGFDPMGGMARAPRISSLQVTGPFDATGITSTPSRERIFICRPETAEEERPCAEQILTNLASRAFRRQATAEDMADPMRFYDAGRELGDFEAGVQQGLMAILASPKFLYRALTPAEDAAVAETGAPLDPYALASRLSFFLWSAPPDEELLQLASTGAIADDATLDAQVERMLADPRAKSLATNFGFQWLRLRLLDDVEPDPALFPEFDGDLRRAFRTEMELFVDEVFRGDHSVMNLLDADYTFVNERLALHYGLPGVRGDRFRKVTLEDSRRHGVLGKGAILMLTSYGNRTSPVLRGTWVLENIIGTPPAAPPPNVEAFPENQPGQAALTVRERLVAHRAAESCNACHGVIDPLGLALENFDAIGSWRDKDVYAGMTIDASTEMVDGRILNGPEDLRAAMAAQPELFVRAFTRKLMTFALARGVEYHDMPQVRQIVRDSAGEDYSFASLVKGIVRSPQFRMVGPPPAEEDETQEASLQTDN